MKHKMLLSGLLAFLVTAATASAAGFTILEQSAKGMGRALGGISADIEDPNAQYFNPSLTGWFDHDAISIGNHFLKLTAQYKDRGSSAALGSDTGNDIGGWSIIPNAYWVHPLANDVIFNLGFSATSGTKTEHSKYWVGRYTATMTDLAVIDFAPSLAYRINDEFSIGYGLVVEYAEIFMDRALPYGGNGKDGKLKISGDSYAVGYTLGLTYRPEENTTIALGFRSSMRHDMDLRIRTHNYGNARGSATTKVHLPASLSLGLEHRFTEKWKVGLDVSYYFQSSMKDIRIRYDNNIPGLGKAKGAEDRVRMGWRNTWRLALGQEYKMTDKLTLRSGIAWDQTPCTNRYRNTQLPDADRYWLSFGFGYQLTKQWAMDAGYTHIWFDSVSVKMPGDPMGSTTVRGKFSSCCTDTFSLSFTYRY